ncbi:MAG: hypothetical protein GEV11_04455 [Streptosporangiales bacterium]|nr:hypothetical protein [Streptosporangiales bacterium]
MSRPGMRITFGTAMRARDVSRPRPEDYQAARKEARESKEKARQERRVPPPRLPPEATPRRRRRRRR